MITGSSYYYDPSGCVVYEHPKQNQVSKTYYKCVNCGSVYLLPETKGTSLIRLVCTGCGGNLKEHQE